VKPCGGRVSLASKSSGARRFFPMVVEDDEASGDETVRRSGVRALNTGGGCAALRSGVFGLGNDDGPETARWRGVRVAGDGTYAGTDGI